MMILRVIKESFKPLTIAYPIPIFPVIIGLNSTGIYGAVIATVVNWIFYPAINLWNHVNDAEDDFKAGKNTPFLDRRAVEIAIFIIFLCYLISGFLVFKLSKSIGFIFFIVLAIITFLYSDKKITKIRLKSHYIGELLTYLISIPLYGLILWDLSSPVNLKGIILAITLTPLAISTVFLKDLKDIREDREAGLKNLGVVFSPELLLKLFSFSIFLYYILLILFSIKYNYFALISLIPLIFHVIAFNEFRKEKWLITLKISGKLKLAVYSALTSTLLLLIASLINIF